MRALPTDHRDPVERTKPVVTPNPQERGRSAAGLIAAALCAVGCGSGQRNTPNAACNAPSPAPPSFRLTTAWTRSAGEPPLVFIREVGHHIAVCSRAKLHLLADQTGGGLREVASAPLSGCHRLASDAGELAVLGDASVVTFPDAGTGNLAPGPVLSALPASAHDLAVAGGTLYLAADDGVHPFALAGGSFSALPVTDAGLPVRAIAIAAGSAYLGRQIGQTSVIEQRPLAGGVSKSIQFNGLVEYLVIQGDRGLALNGGFGLASFAAGSSFGAAPSTLALPGVISGARVVGHEVLISNRASLERLGPVYAPREREAHYRRERGSSSGAWFEGIAIDAHGPLALTSGGVDRVALSAWTPRPLLATSKVRVDIRTGERSALFRVLNHGQADLVVAGVSSTTRDWSGTRSSLDLQPVETGCPKRLTIAPDDGAVLELDYSGHSADSNALLTIASNDSDLPDLPLAVSWQEPPHSIQVGDAAPDFSLPLLGGGEMRLGDLAGHVAYLKFFSPG